MMARQHVNFAVATYVTGVGALSREWSVGNFTWEFTPLADWAGATALSLALSVLIVGGHALVPDLDHPNSTLTRKLGIFGKILYPFISALAGGHRKGMHSIFMVLTTALLYWGVSQLTRLQDHLALVAALMTWFMGSIVVRFIVPQGNHRARELATWLMLVVIAVAFLWTDDDVLAGNWLPVAAAVGVLLHDVGDFLTDGKVRFFWPVSQIAVRAPVTFPTGKWFESVLMYRFFLIWALAAVAVFVAYPAVQTVMEMS